MSILESVESLIPGELYHVVTFYRENELPERCIPGLYIPGFYNFAPLVIYGHMILMFIESEVKDHYSTYNRNEIFHLTHAKFLYEKGIVSIPDSVGARFIKATK